MKQVRKIGDSTVKPIGLGCWAIGGAFWDGDEPLGWGNVDDNESLKTLELALELGIDFWDTADVYGAGHSETLLGKALKGNRDKVVLATKFGFAFDESTKKVSGAQYSSKYIKSACENSLRRLQTDYIDLYQLHLNDLDLDSAAQVFDTLDELVENGKIKNYGWSTDFPDRAKLAQSRTHNTSIQFEQNIFNHNTDMVAQCIESKTISINRAPLAMGLLSGKFSPQSTLEKNDIRFNTEWVQYFKNGKATPEFLEKLEQIKEILKTDGRSLIQGAICWLWGLSPYTLPIPGFKSRKQLEENMGSLNFEPLNESQMQEIENIIRPA